MKHPMEWPLLYRLWQAPFAERKLRPLLRLMTNPGRVLDIGCGPGTNAHHFIGSDYLGVDINEEYIRTARRRLPMRFEVADATALSPDLVEDGWDQVLINSLMHHLDDAEATRLLRSLPALLAPQGRIHILDLVLPPAPGPSRLLARLDRGRHARPEAAWRDLFERHMAIEHFEVYSLGAAGIELWRMVYCVGSARAL